MYQRKKTLANPSYNTKPLMARNDQNEIFLKAYTDYSDAIFRHCYFRLYARDRAKDLTQETFMRAWEYIAKGNTVDNIRAFLYRIANNLVIDESRKKTSVSLEVMREQGFEPSFETASAMDTVIEAKRVIAAFKRIDPAYRDIVLMRYIDDMTPKEIAHVLGESENAVSVRIHRGIKKIKELFPETKEL